MLAGELLDCQKAVEVDDDVPLTERRPGPDPYDAAGAERAELAARPDHNVGHHAIVAALASALTAAQPRR